MAFDEEEAIREAASRLGAPEPQEADTGAKPFDPDKEAEAAASRILGEDRQRQAMRLQSYELGETASPDDAALHDRLAKKYGVPRRAVEYDAQSYKDKEAAERHALLERTSPNLLKWVDDADNYAVARDDFDNLSAIEKLMRGDVEAPMGQFIKAGNRLRGKAAGIVSDPGAAAAGAVSDAGSFGRSIATAAPAFTGGAISGFGEQLSALQQMNMDYGFGLLIGGRSTRLKEEEYWARRPELSAKITPYAGPANLMKTYGGVGKDIADEWRPDDQGFWGQVGEGLGQVAIAVGLAIPTGGKSLTSLSFAGLGIDQQAESMRAAGLDPNDYPGQLAAGGSITAISEKVRLNRIMKAIPASARKSVWQGILGRIAREGAEEGFQEIAEGLGQNALTMTYDEEARLIEGLAEAGGVGATVGAIFQAGIELAIPGKSRITVQHARPLSEELERMRTEAEPTEGETKLSNLIDLAVQSKTARRSPEKIEQYIAGMVDDATSTVAIDAEGLAQVIEDNGLDPDSVMEDLGLDPDALQKAAEEFGDVEVSTAKLAASKTLKNGTLIKEHARFSSEAMTPAQREQRREADIGAMKQVFNDFLQGKVDVAVADMSVTEQFMQRIEETGMYGNPREIQSGATIMSALVGSLAKVRGISIEQAFADHAPAIQGHFGLGGEMQTGALDQEGLPMDETARMSRAKADGFDTDTVLYHGTGADFSKFNKTTDGKFGPGVYLTSDSSEASQFAVRGGRRNQPEGGASVLPVLIRGKIATADDYSAALKAAKGNKLQAISDLKNKGFGGIKSPAYGIDSSGPSHVVIFDPKNIRSKFAKFDPEKRDSANLLDQPGLSGQFSPRDNIIHLFEAKNVSTLMHESAHWYLQTLIDLQARGQSTPEIDAMLAGVQEWYDAARAEGRYDEIVARYDIVETGGKFVLTYEGEERGQFFSREEAEQKRNWREMHEAFAETFEVYLRNGKAPNAKLRDAFRFFRDFLTNLYRKVKGNPSLSRANLNPEITAIFDRMLAVDDMVDGASSVMEIEANQMLQKMLDAGVLTEKEHARAVAKFPKMLAEMKEDLSARLWNSAQKRQDALMAGFKRDIRDAVAREYDASPVGRAEGMLGRNEWMGDVAEDVVVDDVNALTQEAPRSIGAMIRMTDEQIGEWYVENIREVRQDIGDDYRVVNLHFKTDDSLEREDAVVNFKIEGGKVNADLYLNSKTTADVKIKELTDAERKERQRKAANMFARAVAAIKHWVSLEQPGAVVFSGSSADHEKLYNFMLSTLAFEGYTAHRVNTIIGRITTEDNVTEGEAILPPMQQFVVLKDGENLGDYSETESVKGRSGTTDAGTWEGYHAVHTEEIGPVRSADGRYERRGLRTGAVGTQRSSSGAQGSGPLGSLFSPDPDGLGQTKRPPVPDTSVAGGLTEKSLISTRALKGATIFPMFADLTDAGSTFDALDGLPIAPTPYLGGPNFPWLKSYRDAGIVWAFNAPNVISKVRNKVRALQEQARAEGRSDRVVITMLAMKEDAHTSNEMTISALLRTLDAVVEAGRFPQDQLAEAKRLIVSKAGKKDEGYSELATFPGFGDAQALHDWSRGATFAGRKALAKEMRSAKFQQLPGMFPVERIVREAIDPDYRATQQGDALLAFEIDPDADDLIIDFENKDQAGDVPRHPAYRYGMRGTLVGSFSTHIPMEVLYADLLPEVVGRSDPTAAPMYLMKLLRTGDAQVVTEDIVREAEVIEGLHDYRIAQAHVSGIAGQWRSSDVAANKGGDNPVEFERALLENEAAATLTPYTRTDVTKGKKNRALRVFQLGSARVQDGGLNVWMAVKTGYDYRNEYPGEVTDALVEQGILTDNEVALVGVASNELGVKGMATFQVLKGIEEGVTVLDAFKVTSPSKPDGLLPTIYATLGFEEVGQIPFDPKYYDAQQLADLKAIWTRQGWNEADGYPAVAIMKWRGDDAVRPEATRRFILESQAGLGIRGEPNTVAVKAAAGRVFNGDGQSDQGDGLPGQGDGRADPRRFANRARGISSTVRGYVENILAADARAIKALKLPQDLIDRIREEYGPALAAQPDETLGQEIRQPERPLSRSAFRATYMAHIDIRSKTPEEAQQTADAIQAEGFKPRFNVNALPPYRGGPPQTVTDRRYAPRAGQTLYLVPKPFWEDAPNGPQIVEGWKPQPFEIIQVTEDFPDVYELYVQAFNAAQPDETFGQGEGLVSAAVRIGGKTYTGRNREEYGPALAPDPDGLGQTVDGKGGFQPQLSLEEMYRSTILTPGTANGKNPIFDSAVDRARQAAEELVGSTYSSRQGVPDDVDLLEEAGIEHDSEGFIETSILVTRDLAVVLKERGAAEITAQEYSEIDPDGYNLHFAGLDKDYSRLRSADILMQFDDYAIEAAISGEPTEYFGIFVDPKAITRIQKTAVAEVTTLSSALEHPNHHVRAAAFREILDQTGIKYRTAGPEGVNSEYIYAEGLDGEVKIRFSDHARQSGLHDRAAFNFSDNSFSVIDYLRAIDSLAGDPSLLAQKRRNPNGWGAVTPPSNVHPVRLDLKSVRDAYGDEAVDRLPRSVVERATSSNTVEDMMALIETIKADLKAKPPKSLFAFVRSRGRKGKIKGPNGISGAADDLRALGLENLINEKSGRDIDYVRELAEEAGYLQPSPDGQTTSINDLLEALQREANGDPVYAEQDLADASANENAEGWRVFLDENDVDIYEEDKRALEAAVRRFVEGAQEDAVTADEAADMFGFDTGEDLIAALIQEGDRERVIRDETERRFKEEYGDLYESGQLANEIEMEVNTELRARKAEMEFEALTRAAGRLPARRLARQMAQESLSIMPIGEINKRFKSWRRDAETHGRNALAEAQKGNWDKVAQSKKYELVALAMHEEGAKLLERAEKVRADLTKYETSKYRREKIANDYLERIDALLEGYELRKSKQGPSEQRRRQSAADYVAWMTAEGREDEIAAEASLLAEMANDKVWRNLTIDEADYLHATVKNLAHLGRTKDRLLNEQDKRRFNAVIDELVGRMKDTGKLPPIMGLKFTSVTRDRSPTRTVTETAVDALREGNSWLMRPEHQARSLDGEELGPVWQAIFRPMAEASDVETRMMRESTALYREAWSKFSAKDRKRMMNVNVSVPELRGIGKRFTRMDLISIALNWGVEYNRDVLMEGYGWNKQQVESALFRTLGDKEWDFVEAIWEIAGMHKEEAFALEKDMTGVEPKAVEGVDFTLPSGRVIKGKYYHIEYDGNQPGEASRRQLKDNAAAELSTHRKSRTKAQTKNGGLIARKGSGGRPVKLSLSVFERGLSETIHDIAFRRAVLDVGRIVSDKSFADTYQEVAGLENYRQLDVWLKDIANPPSEALDPIVRAFAHVRRNIPIAVMGMKVGTALIQPSGILAAMPIVGHRRMALAVAQAFANPNKSLFGAWSAVAEKSEFMRDRIAGYERDVRETTTALTKGGATDFLRRNAFVFINGMDVAVSTPVWMAAYGKAFDGKVKGIQAGQEEDAILWADGIIRRTQTAGKMQDLSRFQRGGEFQKQISMIFSYFNNLYALSAQNTMDMRRGKMTRIAWAYQMSILFVAIPLMAEAMAGRLFPGDDDDDDDTLAGNMGQAVISNFAGMFPGIRDVVSLNLKPEFGYRLSPTAKFIEDIGKTAGLPFQLALDSEKELTEYDVKRAVNALGGMTGIPSAQINITGDYIVDLIEGNEDPAEDPVDAMSEAFVRNTR